MSRMKVSPWFIRLALASTCNTYNYRPEMRAIQEIKLDPNVAFEPFHPEKAGIVLFRRHMIETYRSDLMMDLCDAQTGLDAPREDVDRFGKQFEKLL